MLASSDGESQQKCLCEKLRVTHYQSPNQRLQTLACPNRRPCHPTCCLQGLPQLENQRTGLRPLAGQVSQSEVGTLIFGAVSSRFVAGMREFLHTRLLLVLLVVQLVLVIAQLQVG